MNTTATPAPITATEFILPPPSTLQEFASITTFRPSVQLGVTALEAAFAGIIPESEWEAFGISPAEVAECRIEPVDDKTPTASEAWIQTFLNAAGSIPFQYPGHPNVSMDEVMNLFSEAEANEFDMSIFFSMASVLKTHQKRRLPLYFVYALFRRMLHCWLRVPSMMRHDAYLPLVLMGFQHCTDASESDLQESCNIQIATIYTLMMQLSHWKLLEPCRGAIYDIFRRVFEIIQITTAQAAIKVRSMRLLSVDMVLPNMFDFFTYYNAEMSREVMGSLIPSRGVGERFVPYRYQAAQYHAMLQQRLGKKPGSEGIDYGSHGFTLEDLTEESVVLPTTGTPLRNGDVAILRDSAQKMAQPETAGRAPPSAISIFLQHQQQVLASQGRALTVEEVTTAWHQQAPPEDPRAIVARSAARLEELGMSAEGFSSADKERVLAIDSGASEAEDEAMEVPTRGKRTRKLKPVGETRRRHTGRQGDAQLVYQGKKLAMEAEKWRRENVLTALMHGIPPPMNPALSALFERNASPLDFVNSMQRLLLRLWMVAARSGYRREGDKFFAEKVIRDSQGRDVATRCYEPVLTISEFIAKNCDVAVQFQNWMDAMTNLKSLSMLTEVMRLQHNVLVPFLTPNRYLVSFENGILDISTGTFHFYYRSDAPVGYQHFVSELPPGSTASRFYHMPYLCYNVRIPKELAEIINIRRRQWLNRMKKEEGAGAPSDTGAMGAVHQDRRGFMRMLETMRVEETRSILDIHERSAVVEAVWRAIQKLPETPGPVRSPINYDRVARRTGCLEVYLHASERDRLSDDTMHREEAEAAREEEEAKEEEEAAASSLDRIASDQLDDVDRDLLEQAKRLSAEQRDVEDDFPKGHPRKLLGAVASSLSRSQLMQVYRSIEYVRCLVAREVYIYKQWCEKTGRQHVEVGKEQDAFTWMQIPTPPVETILDTQKIPWAAQMFTHAMMGRNLFEAGGMEDSQVAFCPTGRAGTGKGTLARILMMLFRPQDIGNYGSNIEQKFGLGSLIGKHVFICLELKKDTSINLAEFQQLVSNEPIPVAIKFGNMIPIQFLVHLVLCMNELPNWRDAGGALLRRLLQLLMRYMVAREKNSPDLRLQALNLVSNIMAKWSISYLMQSAFGSFDIWRYAPDFFVECQNDLRAATHELEQFFQEGAMGIQATGNSDDRIPWKAFRTKFQKWARESQHNNLPPMNADFYQQILADRGMEHGKVARCTWVDEYGSEHTTREDFLVGAKFVLQEREAEGGMG